MKINVVGAGISGVLTAYYAARNGHEVVVYDELNEAAMQCSYANGGQISVCNAKTWNDIPTLKKGIKWLMKKDAPLLIRPFPSYRKMKWLSKFLYTTFTKGNKQATIDTIRLGNESNRLLRELVAEESLDFDQRFEGIMHIYTTLPDWTDSIQDKVMFNENWCDWKNVSREQMVKLEPALRSFKDIIGGSFIKDDWSGDIHKFCVNLRKVLEDKYKVKFVFNRKVKQYEEIEGVIVFANGHQMYQSAKRNGDSFDVYPVKGYSITIDLEDEDSIRGAPTVSLIDNNKKIVASRFGNRFRIAGTAEFTDINYDITRDRIEPLLEWVHKNFPMVNTHNYSQWACLRPMTPDMLPIIQKAKNYDGIFYHGGHGHLGWTLSAATAKKTIELVENS